MEVKFRLPSDCGQIQTREINDQTGAIIGHISAYDEVNRIVTATITSQVARALIKEGRNPRITMNHATTGTR